MNCSIFIRTYHKDLVWLNYALQSIHKFGSGFSEIVICIPENQRHLLNHLTAERIVTCPVYADDYIGQQVSKLNAHKYCNGDLILFTDSDCVFTEPFKPEDFMRDGKPLLLKTHYSKVGDAIAFQPVTSEILGFKVEYEYMRRHPSLYYKSTLLSLDHYLILDAENKLLNRSPVGISEFNIIGGYTDMYEKEDYCIIDTDMEVPPAKLKQYWSWSGLTENEKNEIENLLK